MRRKALTQSICICPECGNEFPIQRLKSKPRNKGHLKKLWCPVCKKEQNMTEIRYNDFYKTMSGTILV